MDAESSVALAYKNGHAHCLICGKQNPLSWGLCFHPNPEGGVFGRLQPHPEMQGYEGMLHGGVVAALLDAAMTHCLFHAGVRAVTGDLHVRFVRPVASETAVELRARIVGSRPPLYRMESELFQDGEVAARAEARFVSRRTKAKTRG